MNLLVNGHFDGSLLHWSGGVMNRSLGYPRPGCAQLDAEDSLEYIYQAIGVSPGQVYTLHFFYRRSAGAVLTASLGDASQEFLGATDVWQEGVLTLGVVAETTIAPLFAAAEIGTCYVDGVSLAPGVLPLTRRALMLTVANRLAGLATDAGLNAVATGKGPEGDYTGAVEEALRQVGAVNAWGDPDITALAADQVNAAIEAALTAMLGQLANHYALETDVSLGPRSESRSQIAKILTTMGSAGAGAGDRSAKMGALRRVGGWER